MRRVWKGDIDWGVGVGERKRETVKERERKRERGVREREKDEESMRIGKERKSPWKTDVPKLYAYNECEHSVHYSTKQDITGHNIEKHYSI